MEPGRDGEQGTPDSTPSTNTNGSPFGSLAVSGTSKRGSESAYDVADKMIQRAQDGHGFKRQDGNDQVTFERLPTK